MEYWCRRFNRRRDIYRHRACRCTGRSRIICCVYYRWIGSDHVDNELCRTGICMALPGSILCLLQICICYYFASSWKTDCVMVCRIILSILCICSRCSQFRLCWLLPFSFPIATARCRGTYRFDSDHRDIVGGYKNNRKNQYVLLNYPGFFTACDSGHRDFSKSLGAFSISGVFAERLVRGFCSHSAYRFWANASGGGAYFRGRGKKP